MTHGLHCGCHLELFPALGKTHLAIREADTRHNFSSTSAYFLFFGSIVARNGLFSVGMMHTAFGYVKGIQ
jgi:hypothetical protein